MKKKLGFGAEIERYLTRRMGPFWPSIGTTITILAILLSMVKIPESSANAPSLAEVAKKAARLGDYSKAQQVYEVEKNRTGANSELERLAYPEIEVNRAIKQWEELNAKYPGSRDILVQLSRLYAEIGENEQASEDWIEARKLDPNGVIFQP